MGMLEKTATKNKGRLRKKANRPTLPNIQFAIGNRAVYLQLRTRKDFNPSAESTPGEHCGTPIALCHHPTDAVRSMLTPQHKKPTLNVLRTEKQ